MRGFNLGVGSDDIDGFMAAMSAVEKRFTPDMDATVMSLDTSVSVNIAVALQPKFE
jgi:hypothetical protein